MKISRRDLVKLGLATGTVLTIPSVLRAQGAPADARTVRMTQGSLTVFDPIFSSAGMAQNHGLAIYDMLFAPDSKLMPQPQMVGNWGVSDDNKTYTFELREGLGWHDGTPVTAADCVASIRRWAQVHAGGQLLMERAKDISKKDEKTFTIALTEPLGILIEILATVSGSSLFIMREQDADRPATEQVTTNIGSGPFKFNEALARPGASITYDKNENYVPRREPPDGFAGGKIVNVDRVVWEVIVDKQTAVAALQAGEIDYLGTPPVDLLPVLQSDPNVELRVLDKSGHVLFLRMNCLQKPFDSVKARQAMLHLVDQEAMMRAAIGDPKYIRTVTSIFGSSTPYTNDENTGWFKNGGDPEKAKQLFKEAGYAGETVVILQPTDWAEASNASQLLATTLRKIGVKAELVPSDWGGLVARRTNNGSVENGGWSIFMSDWADSLLGDPVGQPLLVANGEKGWFGWPKNDEYEAVRAKWPDSATFQERQALARKMQRRYWDFVGTVLLGGFTLPIAHRKTLTQLIGVPDHTVIWNMQKA